jgi:hypothetical protein
MMSDSSMKVSEINSRLTDGNDVPVWEYRVGCNGVDKIEHHVENYGDHGIAWFHVYEGGQLAHSLAASAVAHVEWERPIPYEAAAFAHLAKEQEHSDGN